MTTAQQDGGHLPGLGGRGWRSRRGGGCPLRGDRGWRAWGRGAPGGAVLTVKNRQRCTPETLPTGYRRGGETESRRGQNTEKAKQERDRSSWQRERVRMSRERVDGMFSSNVLEADRMFWYTFARQKIRTVEAFHDCDQCDLTDHPVTRAPAPKHEKHDEVWRLQQHIHEYEPQDAETDDSRRHLNTTTTGDNGHESNRWGHTWVLPWLQNNSSLSLIKLITNHSTQWNPCMLKS